MVASVCQPSAGEDGTGGSLASMMDTEGFRSQNLPLLP